MKLQQLSKSKNGTVKFLVKDTTPAFLNMYRRMLINDVPSMAIDHIEVEQNSSGIYDEMLAHRLGLIILKTDLDACFLKDKKKYTVTLTLEAEGPCTVYAEQIESRDPGVIPMHPKTPITKLLNGQKLKLVATAETGTGFEHIKYSPGLMYYYGNPEMDSKKAESVIKSCKICNKKNKIEAYDLCMSCQTILEDEKIIKRSEKDFVVIIEPWGQLTAQEMGEALSRIADEQFDDFTNAIKKLK
ncbi:MAG: DNA-directed RNA polymerase subunit D [Nanoarchaeota archaeon]|nr:DNA-directed RNA polymerase subunit D [Nanoarchaeota archaeon]